MSGWWSEVPNTAKLVTGAVALILMGFTAGANWREYVDAPRLAALNRDAIHEGERERARIEAEQEAAKAWRVRHDCRHRATRDGTDPNDCD